MNFFTQQGQSQFSESFFHSIKNGTLIKTLYRHGPDFYLANIKNQIHRFSSFLTHPDPNLITSKKQTLSFFFSFLDDISLYFSSFNCHDITLFEQLKTIKNSLRQTSKLSNGNFQLAPLKRFKKRNVNFEKCEKQNSQLTQTIKKISQNKVLLPDPENLCCSKVFYENWKIGQNSTTNILSLSLEEVYIEGVLQKHICAGLNSSRGAVIFVGIDPVSFSVKGLKLSETEKQSLERHILSTKAVIRPHCEIKVDFIPVLSDPLQGSLESQNSSIVVRIKLISVKKKNGYFIHYERKGFHNISQMYILHKGQIVTLNGEQIYSYLISTRNLKKNQVKHYGSICHYPLQRKIIVEEPNHHLDQMRLIPEATDVPIFKYKFQSMLVVGSEKKELNILKLLEELNTLKYKFIAKKPFEKFRRKTGRKIWFISHDEKFQYIDKVKKKIDKGSSISFFSVQRNLVIDDFENKKGRIQEFAVLFQGQFGKSFGVRSNCNDKEVDLKQYYLVFDNLEEAIYAFVYFDSIAVRAVFVKDFQVSQESIYL